MSSFLIADKIDALEQRMVVAEALLERSSQSVASMMLDMAAMRDEMARSTRMTFSQNSLVQRNATVCGFTF